MSGVEGFVYVISNKSMPDYVKIGYTTRDPERRASELSGTALPFPSVVEFYVRVPNAVLVERQTHQRLHAVRVSRDREWFACSRVAAIEAIKASAGSLIQAEKDRVLEEERRRTRKERERQEAELRRRQEEAARDKAEAKQRAIQEVDKKYEVRLASLTQVPHFVIFWVIGSILVAAFLSIFLLNGREPSGGFNVICILIGALAGSLLQEYVREKKKKTRRYAAVEAERDAEIAALDRRLR
ncbi:MULTISPECIES: GIY-YIG nuclease family protein [Caballeronia]|jgi:hypothetical protein|uniref:GIY-YIG nuclease family protein n=1 Tax=Caballeronia jiangsuensis TaxID=1458357 RepID=A0ABW9CHX4_9BURK|nr:GIY-YIG nuclease family protein [Caballeronia sp. GaOx3]